MSMPAGQRLLRIPNGDVVEWDAVTVSNWPLLLLTVRCCGGGSASSGKAPRRPQGHNEGA
jgi:hypothetical protein